MWRKELSSHDDFDSAAELKCMAPGCRSGEARRDLQPCGEARDPDSLPADQRGNAVSPHVLADTRGVLHSFSVWLVAVGAPFGPGLLLFQARTCRVE